MTTQANKRDGTLIAKKPTQQCNQPMKALKHSVFRSPSGLEATVFVGAAKRASN